MFATGGGEKKEAIDFRSFQSHLVKLILCSYKETKE